ncbi:IucA/IucC family protein [Shouchella patagoniensis]|uniref:IucA/IucC family protein n=1 Tax=Shouchella patagoniensis TaxID=228576 RepID=UPI001FE8F157|nr:IucA/IucC family protein [Shouchella patagoniensis]
MRGIDENMLPSAKRIAENASLQAFLNSFTRETGLGKIVPIHEIEEAVGFRRLQSQKVMKLGLARQACQLLIEVHYESLVGRHTFGTVLKESYGRASQEEEPLAVMILLIQELHLQTKANPQIQDSTFEECLVRMIESCQTMGVYIEERMNEKEALYEPKQSFIDSEQSLLYGHWLHPTPKSRQGMTHWQQQSFAPELKGDFQLYYFYVHHTILEQESLGKMSAWEMVSQEVEGITELPELDEKWLTYPMHPLQAEYLLCQPHVKEAIHVGLIKDIGPAGKRFTATSSIRTVYSESSKWMYKFSIPVKVTNSLRNNKRHELRAGILVAKLLTHSPWLQQSKTFTMITDPAYLTVRLPGLKESGFETIIRENPFSDGGQGISSIAALVQDPLPGCSSKLKSIIVEQAEQEKTTVANISIRWFNTYITIALQPLIRLYDELGVALEAHQQNSLLDVSEGYPSAYYYRDNQGYYLADSYKALLLNKEPDLLETNGLFYEDSLIENRFSYYLLMNQVFSIIHRFGVDGLIDESILMSILRSELERIKQTCIGAGRSFIGGLLEKEKLAFKANLLTRFHDVDELAEDLEQAVYVKIKNPLHKEEEKVEVAYAKAVYSTN